LAELNAGGAEAYECRVGLWLNMKRTEARRTAAVLSGITQAMSGSVNPELIKALADSEEQAAAEINRYQASQQSEL